MITHRSRMTRCCHMLVGTLQLSIAPSAQALDHPCYRGEICLYEHIDPEIGMYIRAKEETSDLGSWRAWRGRFNDKATIVANFTDKNWCLFEHKNLAGAELLVYAGSVVDLTQKQLRSGVSWNDQVTSFRPTVRDDEFGQEWCGVKPRGPIA